MKTIVNLRGVKMMENLKYLAATFLFVLIGLKVYSQQDPMYTQYMNNPLSVNPAYAGTRNVASLTGVFRKQWVGIEGAPTTSAVSFTMPNKKFHYGLGASLLYDALGPVTQTGLYLDYAYFIRFDQKGTLSLGLKGGFNYFYIDYKGLRYNDTDTDLDHLENEALFLPNFGVGAYYYTDKLYLGLSVPKLLKNTLDKNNSVTVEHLNREEWHCFLMGGYVANLTEHIDLKPSFIARYAAGSPLSLELTATVMLYDKVWIGGMYRVGDSFGGLVRWQVNPKIHIGYSYDLTCSVLRSFNTGTHEIFIGFDFLSKERSEAVSRFF